MSVLQRGFEPATLLANLIPFPICPPVTPGITNPIDANAIPPKSPFFAAW